MFKRLSKSPLAHKILIAFTASFLAAVMAAMAVSCKTAKKVQQSNVLSSDIPVQSEPVDSVVSEAVSSEESSVPEAQPVAPKPAVKPEPVIETPPVVNTDFHFNGNLDPESNVFLDAMVYTGYNIQKHRSDGLMWVYILCAHKRAKGWLSNITYGGGSSGYETTPEGLPDIRKFEKNGLVCASYATYVYFNYLPNVAGIDTSYLTRPVKTYSAADFAVAARDWLAKGYCSTIGFSAGLNGNLTVFKPESEIPIGSIMLFRDFKKPNSTVCSHVAIYAGYVNGSNWVYHVGNANGPEFCTMERMSCGPDPQWPIQIITTPKPILDAITAPLAPAEQTPAEPAQSEQIPTEPPQPTPPEVVQPETADDSSDTSLTSQEPQSVE